MAPNTILGLYKCTSRTVILEHRLQGAAGEARPEGNAVLWDCFWKAAGADPGTCTSELRVGLGPLPKESYNAQKKK